MGREFEVERAAELVATPEEVWEAIATGPGIDSWFIGRNEVDGGAIRTLFGRGYIPGSTVTARDPGRRLAHRSEPAPGGRFVAYEFLIEGRHGGGTVLRTVTSGFLPGDGWEDEYEAMTLGGDLYFRTLVERLTHFRGRTATSVTAFGPPVSDWEHAWSVLHRAIGDGDAVRFTGPAGPVEGVVYFRNAHTLGVRTGDALYRFLRGFHGAMIAGHVLFAAGADTDSGWESWLAELYG